MTRAGAALAAFAIALLATSAPVLAASPVRDVAVGYLGLENDPRYDADLVYTRIEIAPTGDPSKGAELGFNDLKILTDAVGVNAVLDKQQAPDAAGLMARLKDMAAAGEKFVILDLPADLVDQVSAASQGLGVTLVNATAHEDFLRDRCYPNLLHTSASDRMLSDALTQLLRTRNWTRVLMLVGPEARDQALAESFAASAKRLRIDIVDTRAFTLAKDPANRDANNTLLLTGGVDYDVVYVADSDGEFSRYLPYATQSPRPIIGATGLTAAEWQWSWDRDGATQVTSRYDRLTGGRQMGGADWSTWIAAKSVLTAYGKSRKTDPDDILAYLRGPRFGIDGSKGVEMSFRPWDGQLRMPITLSTFNAVIDVAPLSGFSHEVSELDSLGTDEPEHSCK
jgi:ABC transporter substrate binding protein (PQQ-dependent alcohol dehydrogenase system)